MLEIASIVVNGWMESLFKKGKHVNFQARLSCCTSHQAWRSESIIAICKKDYKMSVFTSKLEKKCKSPSNRWNEMTEDNKDFSIKTEIKLRNSISSSLQERGVGAQSRKLFFQLANDPLLVLPHGFAAMNSIHETRNAILYPPFGTLMRVYKEEINEFKVLYSYQRSNLYCCFPFLLLLTST